MASNTAFEEAVGDFSFSLYNAVEKSGNELISPYSITSALMLLMLAKAVQCYGSGLKRMNFRSAPDQSRININNWIANATKDTIKDMFPPKTITSGTVMVLANAIYFKGTWKSEFNPHNTTKRNFLDNFNQQKQVDMMYDRRYVNAGENTELDCKILQLQ
ncbi:unnamed protein product [Mytilus coruscus]|uniref:Serpin domain-containing protein n=1 Tax=Mytilus coruscus TaxID=42192 RepID=A0A6J8ETW5_MYTCO|nr:unnamed protein product [Mytilus coruscus]